MRLLRLVLAGGVAMLVAAAGPAARAIEPPPGSRNFEPPVSAPNYFSNEAGPFRGGAGAETTYSSPQPIERPMVVSPNPPAGVTAAPRRSASRHAVRGKSRTRLAYARTRSKRHLDRPRLAKTRAALRFARVKAAGKIAAVRKRGATKSLAARHHPAATKGRPNKDRRTHTASR